MADLPPYIQERVIWYRADLMRRAGKWGTWLYARFATYDYYIP